MNIFDLYNIGKDVYNLLNNIKHSDKEKIKLSSKKYLGEVLVQDSNGCLWEVKVRYTESQRRYLKIQSKSNGSRRMRATADSYKNYSRITPAEWEVFYQLAANQNTNQNNQELYHNAKKVLDRLTR